MASLKPLCHHHTVSSLDEGPWRVWVSLRVAKGERQSQCPVCGRWLFPQEMGTPEETTTVLEEGV